LELKKNAKYGGGGDLVLLGCGRCFIYSALALLLLCDHMICDARYLVMSVIICEVENGTHFSLHHASPTSCPPVYIIQPVATFVNGVCILKLEINFSG